MAPRLLVVPPDPKEGVEPAGELVAGRGAPEVAVAGGAAGDAGLGAGLGLAVEGEWGVGAAGRCVAGGLPGAFVTGGVWWAGGGSLGWVAVGGGSLGEVLGGAGTELGGAPPVLFHA